MGPDAWSAAGMSRERPFPFRATGCTARPPALSGHGAIAGPLCGAEPISTIARSGIAGAGIAQVGSVRRHRRIHPRDWLTPCAP
ncbi:hypothetical protein SXIM_05540 [Streptomyces xiamenensis]|uniref:Uncharacterized protein n=1 Tax=Streptomyces xiamenensis TaxID=408015 RepID=A0A0F7FR73_9ACTN|nr:hypothetical protein SXIM_05540 [Streptomyces xiamenensis]